MACARAKKSSASLDMAGPVSLAAGVAALALVDAGVDGSLEADVDGVALRVVGDGADADALDRVRGAVALDAPSAAAGLPRATGRKGARVLSDGADVSAESSVAEVELVGSSMLAGVAERDPEGVGLAWIA